MLQTREHFSDDGTPGKCPFLEELFEELNAPMPPRGFSVSPAQTKTSLWQQFIPSDLNIDWEKGRSCYFLMGKCPNSVCFIKKIA